MRSVRSSFRPVLEHLEDRRTPSDLPTGFTETIINTGGSLAAPTSMAFAPDGRLFVTEQAGTVKLIKNGNPQTALNLTVNVVGERGLLGLAFDPNFESNRFAYLYYTALTPAIHNRISRFKVIGDTFTNEQVILDLDNLSGATNHNGGAIHFGTDGMLYAAVGDNANTTNAQTLSNLHGKMLRINVAAYPGTPNSSAIIPTDNPFFATATGKNRLIWALGLRNPFTFGVQQGTGRIYINDVGQNSFEEINEGIAGGNYGWANSEGFRQGSDLPTTIGTYRDPLMAYAQGGTPGGCAIVGGAFYNPPTTQFPASFVGKYFYADLCNNYIRVFDPANPGSLGTPDTSTGFATNTDSLPVDLDVDIGGSLYYLARGPGENTGVIKRIQFTEGPFPQRVVVAPDRGGPPTVRIFSPTNILLGQFNAYGASFTGGVRVAVGDVNGDMIPDIFTAPGVGGSPVVNVFNGQTFALIRQIQVYGSSFTLGVNLTVGEVDASSAGPELIVAPDVGGSPIVNVFNSTTGQLLRQIQAYGLSFTRGVRVAIGDVDSAGGNTPEILTAPQAGGAPFVNIFNPANGAFIRQIQVYGESFLGGVFLTTGNFNNAGRADVLVGPGTNGAPVVKAFEGSTGSSIRNYQAYGDTFTLGVRVAAVNVNGDAFDDVLTAPGAGGAPTIKILDGNSANQRALFFVFDASVTSGLFLVGLSV